MSKLAVMLVAIISLICLLGGYAYLDLHDTEGKELIEKLCLENTDHMVVRYFEELPPCQRKPSYNLTQKETIDEILAGIKSSKDRGPRYKTIPNWKMDFHLKNGSIVTIGYHSECNFIYEPTTDTLIYPDVSFKELIQKTMNEKIGIFNEPVMLDLNITKEAALEVTKAYLTKTGEYPEFKNCTVCEKGIELEHIDNETHNWIVSFEYDCGPRGKGHEYRNRIVVVSAQTGEIIACY